MLTAYLDESGTDEKSEITWIGGYIGDSTAWFDFSREWKRVMERHSVPALHMREYTASRGAFEGWKPDAKKALLTDAIDVLNSWDLYGAVWGIDKAAFRELAAPQGIKSPVILNSEPARDPYLWVFQDAVVEFANRADHLHPSERVAFVADHHPSLEAAAARMYHEMQHEKEWPRHSRLGSLSFEEDSTTLPLQAADLLAYEIRKEHDRRLHDAGRKERQSLSRILKRVWYVKYWDRSILQRIIEDSRTGMPTP